MNSKSLIWFLAIVGTYAGAYVPLFWGGDSFSMSSVFFSGVGGIGGIWLGYWLGRE
ncbi:MAG: hypothetical protein Q7K40_00865 [bacterium]|nr:hypothetical protein [bacterium]